MQKQKNETMKTIIGILVLSIIVLLIMFSEDIVNLYYKNKIAKLQNSNIEVIEGNPNVPKLVAGMIPVKCVDTYWQITTQDNWYSYENGEPAYIMLNDGYYRSEIEVGVKEEQLAENNIDAQIQENKVGSIYMWIPRFEINNTTGEIKYISNVGEAEDDYTIPDIFMYKQTKETAPDFLLTGVWVAIDTDAKYATTINNMTGEDNTYGFIANTKAEQITSRNIDAIEKFVGVNTSDNTSNDVGFGVPDDPPISDITNTNRIILKIINTNNIDPIKATATLNADTMEVTINVTYTKGGITKIEDANGNILSENSTTAVDTNILCNGIYYYIITDKLGNTKRIKIEVDITTTLTYNINGGTTTVENTIAGYGDAITLPTPERIYTITYVTNNSKTLDDTIVEYTFDGWYTDETGGEKREYTTMPAHNETLYAHWTSASIILPTLTAASIVYTFEGWYSDSGFTTSVGDGGDSYSPTSNITLYGKWKIQTDYYGALVTNYSAGGVSSWRVFHVDDNGNIYLITNDYVANASIPTDTSGTALYKNGTYKAYWTTTVLGHYTGSAWIRSNTNTKAQSWLSYVSSYPSSTNNNIKAVAYMMDTNKWSTFVNSTYAEYAIGGPTLELYCASYKVTHPNKYIECKVASSTGYQVKWSTASSYSNSINVMTKDDFNKIYINRSTTKAYGCWLASPSAYRTNYLMRADYEGNVINSYYTYNDYAFRPLVCLKSGVELVSNGDGTYQLQ